MKPSHYVIPRTTSECVFDISADPIDRPVMQWQDRLVTWASFIAGAACAAIVIWGA